jgi:hypothetical protein
MRHLTRAFALLSVVLLSAGCPKKADDGPTGPVDTPSYRDAGTGQDGGGLTDGSTQGSTPGDTGGGNGTQAMGSDADAKRQAVLTCVDGWLKNKKLDEFGHPEGTMYAGGSPLFNEATGESKDRLEYVFSRQPDAKKACAPTGQ